MKLSTVFTGLRLLSPLTAGSATNSYGQHEQASHSLSQNLVQVLNALPSYFESGSPRWLEPPRDGLLQRLQHAGARRARRNADRAQAPRNWPVLSVSQRMDVLMAGLLQQRENLAPERAKARWLADRQELATLTSVPPGQWGASSQVLPSRLHGMVCEGLALYKALLRDPALSYMQALAMAETWRNSPLTEVHPHEAYLFLKGLSLEGWVNWERASALPRRPSEILQAVFKRHGQALPKGWKKQPDVFATPDSQSLYDEAALLLSQLRSRGMRLEGVDEAALPVAADRRFRCATAEDLKWLALLEDDGQHALSCLQCEFKAVLTQELQRDMLLNTLFVADSNNQNGVFFDGLALQNAFNLTFDQLLDLPQWRANSELSSQSKAQQRALLAERLTQLGESTQYRIGSVEHSAASVVLRVLRYQKQAPPAHDRFSPLECLKHLDTEWQMQRNYPLRPWLLFSMHLARSSGALFGRPRWREALWVKASDYTQVRWHVV